ncbi:hypothetical protein [Achromobacter spanius]|uniref:hypothetical protein n=1 Tax=Achromobacter spanius TaxID=217203 RepID=UPI00380603DC
MVDSSTQPRVDVREIIERQRAIERQNDETFRTHNTITDLICVAWIILAVCFFLFGPDFMGIREGAARVETSEDAIFVSIAFASQFVPFVWAPIYLFRVRRKRWPPVTPSAAVRAEGRKAAE